MKNITLAIDDVVLDKARAVAAKRGTTVNAMVREHLSQVASEEEQWARARVRFRELIDRSSAEMGADYKWNRESLYDD